MGVEGKDEEAVRVLGLNIKILSFCQKENYKAERLRFIFEKYRVDTIGLYWVCINWSDLKASQMLASLLRGETRNIHSVVSHNKLETNNIGKYQRGDTATITRQQMEIFIIDSRDGFLRLVIIFVSQTATFLHVLKSISIA